MSVASMERLLKLPQVEGLVGLKKSKIYALIQDGRFPVPVKVGRASLWLEQEVQGWIAEHASRRTMPTVDVALA